MKYCPKCGAQLPDDAMFCGSCGSSLAAAKTESSAQMKTIVSDDTTAKVKEVASAASDKAKEVANAAAERAKQAKAEYDRRVLENAKCFVKLNDGEVLVKTYLLTVRYFPRMDGMLEVTNKRLIFHGAGWGSKLLMEVPIDSVGAISIFKGFYIKLLPLILGIVGVVLTFVTGKATSAIHQANSYFGMYGGRSTGSTFWMFMLHMLVLALTCFFFWLGFQKSMNVAIKSNKAMGNGIVTGKFGTFGAATLTLNGRPGTDADKCMAEIGAIVMDIQQKGDLAIEKWKQ